MKRLFDILFSAVALLILSPALLILAVVIKKKLGSPILFKQERPGLNSKKFVMYKFRSMKDCTSPNQSDAQRLSTFGLKLRASSLDELPELFNVLKGDMSLVGPRPLLVEYLSLYTPEQLRRHEVRPGITGWAQINGRNALSWDEKFKMDVWYVDNRNFFLDIKIIILTIKKVFFRENINAAGEATASKFTGTKDN